MTGDRSLTELHAYIAQLERLVIDAVARAEFTPGEAQDLRARAIALLPPAPDGAYIAIAPCGCVHGIDTEDEPETHRRLEEWRQRGSTIQRLPFDEARERIQTDCPHEPKWGRM